jgi:hypothetical protein
MNEQISLAYSVQSSGSSSIAFSVIPTGEGGALNTEIMVTANISSPAAGSPEALLLSSVSEAVAAFRAAKGF